MNIDELRSAYLNFFEQRGHKIVPSSSLIPHGDPTLLLTNAGMVQFKPYFLRELIPDNPRAVTCQKCFRTSDIDSVGDPNHCTLFEMLGNFSFGDYFKKEAIEWAWEFVTGTLKLPKDRLWITIYQDDDEAFGYWRALNVPADRIIRLGADTNFWGPAGDSGPCGPCSEIHYDFGPEVKCEKPDCTVGCDCGRYSEIWNLVFNQFNQEKDGKRVPLAKPGIDTGMGLERTLCVVQGKRTVYETDAFIPMLNKVSELCGKRYGVDAETDRSMRIVAEHSRGIPFLIGDGVLPSNEGRGYVLRRLLRRATIYGRKLGMDKPFLTETASLTMKAMSHVYPELKDKRDFILQVISVEENKFMSTLEEGLNILEGEVMPTKESHRSQETSVAQGITWALKGFSPNTPISTVATDLVTRLKGLRLGGIEGTSHGFVMLDEVKPVSDARDRLIDEIARSVQSSNTSTVELESIVGRGLDVINGLVTVISGMTIFRLHDTYGFPPELTSEIAASRGFKVDMDGFKAEMEKQRERARSNQRFGLAEKGIDVGAALGIEKTKFTGYDDLSTKTRVLGIVVENQLVGSVESGQEATLILESTPFYGEMGGQMGDTGKIQSQAGVFTVTDAVKMPPEIAGHKGKIESGKLSVGDSVEAIVDKERRLDIGRNHTATHLLQAALRQVLGQHVEQRGSLVAPDRLRFDFSHLVPMNAEQIRKANHIVNEMVRQDLPVYAEEMPYKKALQEGATAIFAEKYGDVVRVLRIGRPVQSVELCGGTHLHSTGEIGFFRITSESSVGASLRRIEAVTGRGAEAYFEQKLAEMDKAAETIGAEPGRLLDKAASVSEELKEARRRVLALERELSQKSGDSLLSQVQVIKGVNVLVGKLPPTRVEVLRETSDKLRDELKSGIIVLGTVYEDRPLFLAVVTQDLVEKGYNAGNIIRQVAKAAGGGGGGKPNLAQAGGKDKEKIDEALALVKELI